MRSSERIRRIIARAILAGAVIIGAAARAEAPARVVSINLCTDQLAMLIAGEGQLLSVSHIARDRRVSAMADLAAGLDVNYGRAEEIYMLRPDLVLAQEYSPRATLAMLRRLGIPVVTLPDAATFGDVRANMAEMGRLLGREDAAAALIAEYDARLAALRDEAAERPRAVLYQASGYTSGGDTLAGRILIAAGFANAAAAADYGTGAKIPLEVLAMLAPDLVLTSEPYPGASRSEEMLRHPVVAALREGRRAAMTDHDWICGTPFVLRAVEHLAATRAAMTGTSE
ncbi:ABC transporter substrate-binding protein [Roseovarius spongiae]|uniref:ABC transporter substrate-binding protein n=1 Tax=Roseovarius spongiae TaxID=2320272 RepID=UPI0014080B22|nr:ABC transporter substrate-binding protein [Roseovarius spongiae]